jgi:replicative DNA helicase
MVKATVQEDEGAAEQLKQMRLKSAMRTLKQLAPTELEDVILGAETELSQKAPTARVTWKHITEYKAEIAEAVKWWGKVGGISTGLPSFDAVIGGLRKGQTVLVAGESNNGKSALAAQIAVNVSKHHKVGYISLEMLPGDNGARINHMNGGDEHNINVDGLDIYFQSTTEITYKNLDSLFKEGKEMGMEVMMLDYLQFLGRGLNIDEVGAMSKAIKSVALKYELPFIVIVSLRKGQARRWTEIGLDDLMGTSAIGYDADNTIVVSRLDMENKYDEDHVYIKVLKLRNMRKTKQNEFLMFDWHDTKITEPIKPLHLMVMDGDITDEGKIVTQ